MTRARFPSDFVWGVATSAYQIEGGVDRDGRGASIWDRFAATPGTIEDGSDGRRACEHYDRWPEDVALMRGLGLGAYRFSIGWPRVLPTGRGPVNGPGLDFYDRLVDALLAAGLAPFVTLDHWDLPQALQDEGGWAHRATVDAFVDYADRVSARLGDRVQHWMTHNEPWCIATLGHEQGVHAPGLKDPALALRAAHHLLLSHGRAVPVLRANAPGAQVGIVLILVPTEPASDRAADHDAARWADGFFNRWYLDPLYRGAYPDDAIADRVAQGHLPPGDLPFVEPGDLAAIAAPTDFLGVNYYSPSVQRGEASPDGGPPRRSAVITPGPRTDMGWEVRPTALRQLLVRVERDYRPGRIYITENGAAYTDVADADGVIRDQRRIDFLRGHLLATHAAIADGVPVAGYFHWSLLDNFEWGYGYRKRFGLFEVDFPSSRRVARASAHFYRDVVSTSTVEADAASSSP